MWCIDQISFPQGFLIETIKELYYAEGQVLGSDLNS
jgi:hypothetical protein